MKLKLFHNYRLNKYPHTRHYVEEKSGVPATSRVLYTLTIEDVVGTDRGSVPFTLTGQDGIEHRADINIYVIGEASIQYNF